jgi:hypothetical protein
VPAGGRTRAAAASGRRRDDSTGVHHDGIGRFINTIAQSGEQGVHHETGFLDFPIAKHPVPVTDHNNVRRIVIRVEKQSAALHFGEPLQGTVK